MKSDMEFGGCCCGCCEGEVDEANAEMMKKSLRIEGKSNICFCFYFKVWLFVHIVSYKRRRSE